MQREDIELKVLAVLSAMLREPIGPEGTRADLANWDSLKHIEIVFALEEELGVQFSEDTLPRLDSVKRIVDAVISYHAA